MLMSTLDHNAFFCDMYIVVDLQARWSSPPDVGVQLLHHLLRDSGCRQALLTRSSGAAASPAECMLAQLAASLTEELAAHLPGQQQA
jgi:hypothetical protein